LIDNPEREVLETKALKSGANVIRVFDSKDALDVLEGSKDSPLNLAIFVPDQVPETQREEPDSAKDFRKAAEEYETPILVVKDLIVFKLLAEDLQGNAAKIIDIYASTP